MFDLNEPADEPGDGSTRQSQAEQPLSHRQASPEVEELDGLSLLAQSATAQEQPIHQDEAEILTECRGLSPVSDDNNDENVSSAAMEWSLGPKLDSAAPPKRPSTLPRSESRGSVLRSASFDMLFDDGPKSPADMNVDPVTAEEKPSSSPPPSDKNLCEFLPIEPTPSPNTVTVTNNNNNNTATTTAEVSANEIDLIDSFGQGAEPNPNSDSGDTNNKSSKNKDGISVGHINNGSYGESEDSRFRKLIWQGRVNFQDITVHDMVAACTPGWHHVFLDRKLPDQLNVQRFVTSTDKFVCAVKDYMAEPAVRVMTRSGTSSLNLNKLVQVLVGGGGGTGMDLSLHSPTTKGPAVAVIPLHDENNWFADLYLVSASVLSDVEPGELNSADEDLLYGFLSMSPVTSDDSFVWLKDGSRMEVDSTLKTTSGCKKPNGDIVADKRSTRSSSDVSGDNKQDLEEGQLVSEEAGVGGAKEGSYAAYERRKRYSEDEKKAKANGDADGKGRDRHRHRDHERDREADRERGRRDRDREVDHRERDREGVYTRRGNYDYLPRLDTKSIRHRDTDKERSSWENGSGRGASSSRDRKETERSKSKEQERERERGSDKTLKETSLRTSKLKTPGPETGKSKLVDGADRKKRERSPIDTQRGGGKRLKDGGHTDDHRGAEKVAETGIKATYMETDQPRAHRDKNKQAARDSEEPSLSSSDLKTKRDLSPTVDEIENEVYIEMHLEPRDQDTRAWLGSKQNAKFLREEYGVTLFSSNERVDELGPLSLKLSVSTQDSSVVPEAKYFLTRAAHIMKDVAQNGAWTRSLWYPGPVQLQPGGDIPVVTEVVKKLRGDDGKTMEKISEATGVLAAVVLEADNKKVPFVGIRLKSSRKKGLAEATKHAQDLLRQVSNHFGVMEKQAHENGKDAGPEDTKAKVPLPLLYITQVPDYATVRMLKAIFERPLREKVVKKDTELPPGFEQSPELITDVKYTSEAGCAFVEFGSQEFLEGALQLYTADRSAFCGLKVELPTPAALRVYEQLFADNEPPETKLLRARILKSSQQSGDSEDDRMNGDVPRKPLKPLFLTELIKNSTQESIKRLFEDVISTYINPSLDGKSLVLAVRHIPSRGCMFVDLATPELVEFMLDLHTRKPDVFGNMKMELGRAHENTDRKRGLDRSRSERNVSPRPKRRNEMDDEAKKLRMERSDPEKTVYADRLPENVSEVAIRKVFRDVLLEHMTTEQRWQYGEDVVTEVRHVRTKYCAFVVFVSEDLARLALDLYNRDEGIFDRMRLKPHFNSRLEDIYKEEGHEKEDDNSSVGFEHEFQDSVRGGRGGRGFKEVDRRRSVYVDRIPEKYPETAIKDILDRFLKRKGRGSPSYVVSHVSFFRDKYDASKLCAFVEVKNEDAVQDLLECYAKDESAFDGMRIRPAVKYN